MKKLAGIFRFNSSVVLTFALLCFGAFVLNAVSGGVANRALFSVYRSSMLSPLFYIRLFGHVLGHADWAHLSSNMVYLLLLGPLLEEKYGSWNMAVIFVVTAFLTGIVNLLFFNSALLGASGIVFALILLSSFTGVKDKRIPVTFLLAAAIYIGGEVINGVFVRDNISNLTHIIGGAVGGGCGYLLNLKNKYR